MAVRSRIAAGLVLAGALMGFAGFTAYSKKLGPLVALVVAAIVAPPLNTPASVLARNAATTRDATAQLRKPCAVSRK